MNGDDMLFYDGDKLLLTAEEKDTEDGVLIILKGSMRSDVVYQIQDEVDCYSSANMKVTMDWKDVTYASSSALRGLLDSQKNIDSLRKGDLTLRNIPAPILRDMKEIGLTALLYIES